ncbi:MAG: leucine-rich repeat protein [Clostridia bacterium]|nr:leucine-rich repeat protein [Clostridia bacterium]
MNHRNKTRLPALIVTAVLLLAMLISIFASVMAGAFGSDLGSAPLIQLFDGDLKIDQSQFYDGTKIQRLPETVKDSDEISLIIDVGGAALLDAYEQLNTTMSFKEFYSTAEAYEARAQLAREAKALCKKLTDKKIDYVLGESYSTVLRGFEITVKAGDFLDVCKTLGDCNVIVGEVYETEETKLVENNVNAFDTGIFDTTGFEYDGTGMVVAVLDTGTDYYHSAFSTDNFTAKESDWGLTYEDVKLLLEQGDFSAESTTPGLTASDVYISGKLPYGYDYADKDSDVFPINNHHGTHVAGIIAGKDSTITGVAPNAQIVTMKIFSDIESSARTSWIIAALEDCVLLDVDVINMSIGTACGFSRETDKEQISGVYDRIRERGINMVVAASNSFNSTYSSEKNGNLPLTSNPDSSTVGSPSTYEGALSVASIEGAKTSYILFGSTIIYFEESTDRVAEEKHFVEELLGKDKKEVEIEYVVIPGSGLEADYQGIDIKGKIALIRRGNTTFEEKANTAEKMGAAGAIIYNNVSGDIKMNVGETTIPVCSISQNDGELLAKKPSGKIKISYSQAAGPFMSDFSSWGPTPDLGIKPEITAHGGSILSCVPGQDYDRISGTSMATPNISGVTALLRQFVMENFPESVTSDPVEVAAIINRLMMSTADIVYNKNGNPYAVRKQGAGLANLVKCAGTSAYILTYDRLDGSVMDKSKIELGDDPSKSGVYTLKFTIDNFGTTALTYNVDALVMTEDVSETKTNKGDTTVTQTAIMLGAGVEISSVIGGEQNGTKVTVGAGKQATVTLTVSLTDEDKKYLDESFKNGMYVEGFVTLDAEGDTVDLNVPFLAFYGDWTVSPILDLDYFETDKDALDDSIDLLDKTLPDAFATRPVGGISGDYVSYLGSFYYEQKPGSNMISADRKYISLTNHENGVNSLEYIWAGMLRNADYVEIKITDDATGEVVFETIDRDIRKSYGDGGPIRPANIDVGFSAIDENLKNNTKYTVTMQAYLDYGDGGVANNLNNVFTFPLTTDFESPTLTGCEFYTEYDRSAKRNRLFAKMAVYDNHYAMALLPGYVTYLGEEEGFKMENFERYLTPVYSEENSTTYVTFELTDYIDDIKELSFHKNTFAITLYDYALNVATYEIALPTEYTDLYFEEDLITLSPNQTYDLNPIVYPGTEWGEMATYRTSNKKVATVINNKLLAVGSGTARIACEVTLADGTKKTEYIDVKVLAKGDEGYKRYDPPVLESFTLNGYYVNKAYYFLDSTQREIGETGNTMLFVGENHFLSMYPSESVTINYDLDAYFPDNTKVVFESSNSNIVKVTESGTITAQKEGFASVTARVLKDGKSTFYSKTITVEVKEEWVTSGPALSNYYGLGGVVRIPSTLGVTEIGQFAFSNYNYIPKTEDDEINDEVPETTKMWYIGDNTIEEVIIPPGVEKIGPYAFANLTALRKVTLPSTLTTIDYGAFIGCSKLTVIEGIENVKFINRAAFQGTALDGTLKLESAIAIADYAFAGCGILDKVELSENCKSIGAFAFSGCSTLKTVTNESDFVKLSQYAFNNCKELESVYINTAVIPAGSFNGCRALKSITIGPDVEVIGEHAFMGTSIESFTVDIANKTFYPVEGESYLLNKDGTELLLAAPAVTAFSLPADSSVISVGTGAFSGNANLTEVSLPSVIVVNSYAFSECTSLKTVSFGRLERIGDYAFTSTDITSVPDNNAVEIGKYAFANTYVTSVSIKDGTTVGEGAFESCVNLSEVVIGEDVVIGKYAFRYNVGRNDFDVDEEKIGGKTYYKYNFHSPLVSLTIGKNADIGEGAFWFASDLKSVSLGEGAKIGDYAFYTTPELTSIDLSKAVSIGKYAFSGDIFQVFGDQDCLEPAVDENNDYIYRYYSAAITSADLSSAESIGEDAFGYCIDLEEVKLGDSITALPDGAFRYCTSLETVDLSGIKTVGEYALFATALKSAELTSAEFIGEYAFLQSPELRNVSFGDAALTLEEGAFAYCEKLRVVDDLSGAVSIGDYSFAYTDVKAADLSSAEYIGTHAFMKEEAKRTAFALTLGESIREIGDNPFVWCDIAPFYKTVTESFNGKDYTSEVYTFDLGESVRIIDGSLYRVVPSGLELIYYCYMDPTARVADETVRIGAYAFTGSPVVNVVLPYTVASIGHKAFYGCEKLSLVNFASYYAPVLEEEYDWMYFYAGTNLPTPPEYNENLGASGLGIVDYFMWNVTSDPTNFYYGANFIDYVGKVSDKAIMIKPVNGVGYDSFILSQYFDVVLEGANAADDDTLAFIDAMNKLPDTSAISLLDKALVENARALYNKIASREQQGLAQKHFEKLTAAERRISDLEYLENSKDEVIEEEEEPIVLDPMLVFGIVLAVFAGGSILGAALYLFVFKKGESGPDGGDAAPDEEKNDTQTETAPEAAEVEAEVEVEAIAEAEADGEAEVEVEAEAIAEAEAEVEAIAEAEADGEAEVEAIAEADGSVSVETVSPENDTELRISDDDSEDKN